MKQVYEEMIILNKEVEPLYEIQKRSQEKLRILKLAHTTINMIQEWGAMYLNTLASLARKGRVKVEMDILWR